MIAAHLDDARRELRIKTKEMIDAETADVWGARAVAAFELFRATGDIGWLQCAAEYKHEAIEHAAGGPQGTFDRVRSELIHLGAR
jgi:uncharacterized protein YyaL (SSP411 family)